jgi:hypothetical protein
MHKHTDPASAAAELLKRRSIRNSLTEWARHKGFEPAPHHQLFVREIEAFLKSEDEVLLLFAPPGSAKSTYVSVLLPAWYLATTLLTAFWQPLITLSLPSGGADAFGTTLPPIAMCLASRYPMTARQRLDGHSKAEVSTMAWELESASQASVPTWA